MMIRACRITLSPRPTFLQRCLSSFHQRWMDGTFHHSNTKRHRCQTSLILSKGQFLPQTSYTTSFEKNYCSQIVPNANTKTKFLTDIHACTSTEGILDQIVMHKEQSEWTEDELSQCLTHMMTTKFAELDHIPWLQSNIHIAFIQLLLSDELGPRTANIWSHRAADIIMQGLDALCQQMTPRQLADGFLAVLYLGVLRSSKSEEIVPKILFECQDRIDTFDISSLSVLSGIMSRMFPRDWLTMRLILLRTKVLMGDSDIDWTPDTVYDMAHLLNDIVSLDASGLPGLMFDQLLEKLEQGGYLENPDHISYYMRLGRRFFLQHTEVDQSRARHLISLSSDACLKHMDKLDIQHVAECCAALRQSRCFSPLLLENFAKRGKELLRPDLKLRDISNLMYSLSRRTSLSTKRIFENEVYSRLEDVDIVVLSNLAENFLTINIQNHDLLMKYQALVAENAEKLAAYLTRFNKIVRLLIRKPFKNSEHEQKFKDAVLRAMDNQFKISGVALFALYLLPATYTVLDEEFLKRLLGAIPKLSTFDHHRLALGINQMRHPMPAQLNKQIAIIQSCLHEWIMKKSDEVRSIDYLFQLTLEVVVNNRNRDPTLTNHFLEMFPRFTKKLNDVSMFKVIHIFLEIQYYLPEVYEDLVDFVIAHHKDLAPEKVAYLLAALARIGYVPKKFDQFLALMLDTFHDLGKGGSVNTQLLIMRNLNILQIYPETELRQIFSLEYIEKVDRYMEAKPQNRMQMERIMLALNRNAVLECPQLDVPWFHEQQCADMVLTGAIRKWLDKNAKVRGATFITGFGRSDHHHQSPAIPPWPMCATIQGPSIPSEVDSTIFEKDESDKPSIVSRFKNDLEEALLDPEILSQSENLRRWVYSPYGYAINFECILDENQKPVKVQPYASKPVPMNWRRIAILTMTDHCYTYNGNHLLGQELLRWRHLEIMGYRVIDIPYFEWYSMGLSEWQAKVDYLHSKIFSS